MNIHDEPTLGTLAMEPGDVGVGIERYFEIGLGYKRQVTGGASSALNL